MTRKPAKSRETNSRSSPNGEGRLDNISYVPTRKLDHFPGEPHGYLLRSLTPAYWPSVDFSDVAALSNSNIQRTVFNQILLKTESNRQQILSRFLPVNKHPST